MIWLTGYHLYSLKYQVSYQDTVSTWLGSVLHCFSFIKDMSVLLNLNIFSFYICTQTRCVIVHRLTLLLLYTLLSFIISVTTVQLGELATFTCVLPDNYFNDRHLWYKQSARETLKFIVKLISKFIIQYTIHFMYPVEMLCKVYDFVLSMWRLTI